MDILDQFRQGFHTHSTEETVAAAQKLANAIPTNCTLALYGEMGTGKTTFIKGLAQAWQIKEPITSPTFNIFNIYKGKRTLIHVDAYRLENELQADALLLEEFLDPPYCLAIEWPERIGSLLPPDALNIKFSSSENKKHHIQII